MPECRHCLLEVPEAEAIRDGDSIFCCDACAAIYRLINDEGLDDFYARRKIDGWRPGPMPSGGDSPHADLSAFADSVTEKSGMLEVDLNIDGIRCASCVWLNEKLVSRMPGVLSANVNYATHRARVLFDPKVIGLEKVLARIASIGYTPRPYRADLAAQDARARTRDLLVRFGTAAFFSMQLMLYSAALYAGYFEGMEAPLKRSFELIALALCTPVLFYSGWPFISASLRGLRNLTFNMDVLVTLGAGSAYLYSIYSMSTGGEVFFDTSAMIITFVLLGRYIETGAKGRASEAVARLLGLSPDDAMVVGPDGNVQKVTLSSVEVGVIVRVLPGARVPLDGVVASGASECDESMLTGESMVVPKAAGDEVFAATINGAGTIDIHITRVGSDTVLSSIVRAVEDAQQRRAPVQALADRVVGGFVPAIMLLALGSFIARYMMGYPLSHALMDSVSILVIACPCALGLATPLAIVVATSSAASRGILVRGGDVIENSAKISAVVLDKTGTITRGKPTLSHYAATGIAKGDALCIAAALEQMSEHLIGRAIVGEARRLSLDIPKADDFRVHPGQGVSGKVNDCPVHLGSRAFMGSVDIHLSPDIEAFAREHEGRGRTVVFLAIEGAATGIFAISDPVRPDASRVVQSLRSMGMDIAIFTGDNAATAGAIAAEAGVLDVRAGMSPMLKASGVRELAGASGGVMMVGDGINDAPALVEATVGVAVGRATDVALESADVVLMRDELSLLPDALALSRRAYRVIRQNIFWAFFYNMVAVPLAVAGVLHPIVAAGAMALSSLSVVGNSLRARVK